MTCLLTPSGSSPGKGVFPGRGRGVMITWSGRCPWFRLSSWEGSGCVCDCVCGILFVCLCVFMCEIRVFVFSLMAGVCVCLCVFVCV